jgi:hypothetical protein
MHQAPIASKQSSQHIYGRERVLGTTMCNSNVLLLLHGVGSKRYGRYASFVFLKYGFMVSCMYI